MNKPPKITLAALAVLSVLFVGGMVYSVSQPQEPTVAYEVQPQTPPTAEELLRLVNEEREKKGVAPLTIDENVQKSAQLKADDMYTNDYFSHIMPSTGKVLNDEMGRLLAASCKDSSESIYEENPRLTAKGAIFGWVNSKSHYKAMINPDYTLTGFGISGDTITEHFCIAN